MKKTVYITESQLREMLFEAVMDVLGEDGQEADDRSLSAEQAKLDDEAMEKIDRHNQGKDLNGTHYIISVTGNKECYYTLYLFSKPIVTAGFGRNPFIYKGNLSQSFAVAVDKVLTRGANLPIEVCPEGELLNKINRYKKEVFKGGKYTGKSVDEVYATDPQYILWYYKKLQDDASVEKRNPYTGAKYYLTKGQKEMYELLKGYVQTYHEEQIKSRRENIDSVHETEGRLGSITFEVILAKQKEGSFGPYTEIRGKDGNKYYVMYKNGVMPEEEVASLKGRTVSIDSARTQPIEIYGVKYNKLSYVRGFNIV